MKKKSVYPIYLSETDNKKLVAIANKQGISKSAVIRRMISAEKYVIALEQVQINNRLSADFLYELKKCGNNLNQIAYHLNINIATKEEAKSSLESLFQHFKKALDDCASDIEKNTIQMPVKHIKRLPPDGGEAYQIEQERIKTQKTSERIAQKGSEESGDEN